MKILVLTNLYPPHYIGGYELGCRDVVEALRARGHEVQVLTSTYGIEKPVEEGHVLRLLDADFRSKPLTSYQALIKTIRKEIRNQRVFQQVCDRFVPDVVYGWNMRNISLTPLQQARRCGRPVCLLVSDDWLENWEQDAWNLVAKRLERIRLKRLSGALLGAARLAEFLEPLDLKHVQFTSDYLRQAAIKAGKPVAQGEIIHWGIASRPEVPRGDSPTRLLYVGQVVPHKGVHTAIEALALLVRDAGRAEFRLTVAGGSTRPDYLETLRERAQALGVQDRVDFTGRLDREAVTALYATHDILVFPSLWEEPFSITLLEALASGMAVVSTPTGGTCEILIDNENALLFPKEDARACAAQIERLAQDPSLSARLRQKGRQSVEANFTFEGMVDRIEGSLRRIGKA